MAPGDLRVQQWWFPGRPPTKHGRRTALAGPQSADEINLLHICHLPYRDDGYLRHGTSSMPRRSGSRYPLPSATRPKGTSAIMSKKDGKCRVRALTWRKWRLGANDCLSWRTHKFHVPIEICWNICWKMFQSMLQECQPVSPLGNPTGRVLAKTENSFSEMFLGFPKEGVFLIIQVMRPL